jgi:HEAT repeat protein
LGKVTKTTLKPLRIEGNRLSSFMEAYLTQRGKRDRFTDTEFFDACSRLSTMVGTRNITVLLAKLYAEQLIAAKEGTLVGAQGFAPLPDNIPDLMLSYLNSDLAPIRRNP